MDWQSIAAVAQSVGTIVSMAVAVFALMTWRENRKSVNFELIQKLEETFNESVAGFFKLYFENREGFRVEGVSITPDSAEIRIKGILRWYSSLGLMFEFKIVGKKMIGRYKSQFSRLVEDVRIKKYILALAGHQDDCMHCPYYGIFRLVELWGSKDLKIACKTVIAKKVS